MIHQVSQHDSLRDGLITVSIIHFPDNSKPVHWDRIVLAVGNFDGLHRGHTKILECARQSADRQHARAIVLTFDPHPSRIVRPDKVPAALMTMEQKTKALMQVGLDGIAVVRFTKELSQWSPELFIRKVLVDWLQVVEVWVGVNFLFGKNRSGNFSLLRVEGEKHGFQAEKINAVRYRDFVVSSTRVRRLITEGRVDEASALLGKHYFIDGIVVHGSGRGQEVGVATANLETANELLPPNGVYATMVRIDEAVHASITNIGVRPTFDRQGDRAIETHIFDLNQDLYTKELQLSFVQRLRDERHFSDSSSLRAQIDADCREARTLFGRLSL